MRRTDDNLSDGPPNKYLRMDNGRIVENDQRSLRASVHGGLLMEDIHLREKITHFDHERIPERVVHAHGTGLYGYFECTDDAQDLSMACLFKKGAKCKVFTRLSTVIGSRGSIDTPRDVRGFAVRFYTEEGNLDLVGNSLPVFFIHDSSKFPDMVHAMKPDPVLGRKEATTAHDRAWDFFTHSPECAHMLMWVMSPRGIPLGVDTIEGFGVHTFRLINSKGESFHVKFRWTPEGGILNQCFDEAQKSPSDLHKDRILDRLTSGKPMSWVFGVQVIPDTKEALDKLQCSILDATKFVYEEDFPFRKIGRLVLDTFPENEFNENEQAAFCPSHVLDGIAHTNDPLLQGRLFSYLDTQISRLGINHKQIPVNQPICPFATNKRNGKMRMSRDAEAVAYFPNGKPGTATDRPDHPVKYLPVEEQHLPTRALPDQFDDHYSQATTFWISMSPMEQAQLVSSFSFELNNCSMEVKMKFVHTVLVNIHHDLYTRVCSRIGVAPDASLPRVTGKDARVRKSLSLYDAPFQRIGHKACIVVGPDTDGDFVQLVKDACKGLGMKAEVIGNSDVLKNPNDPMTEAGIPLDKAVSQLNMTAYEALVFATKDAKRAQDAKVKTACTDAFHHGKYIMDIDGVLLKTVNIKPEGGVVTGQDLHAMVDSLANKFRYTDRIYEVVTGMGPTPDKPLA